MATPPTATVKDHFIFWTKKMRFLPLDFVGWFSIVYSYLVSESIIGSLERTIYEWADITGTTALETTEYIQRLKATGLAIVTKRPEKSITYGISVKEYPVELLAPNETEISARHRRQEWLTEIKASYHPKRSSLQPRIARREYNLILAEEAKKKKGAQNKILAEENLHEKILRYIEYLKSTPEWSNGGTYLQGLGNFLAGRPWETPGWEEKYEDYINDANIVDPISELQEIINK